MLCPGTNDMNPLEVRGALAEIVARKFPGYEGIRLRQRFLETFQVMSNRGLEHLCQLGKTLERLSI
jgi:hypothetical protein